MPSDPSLRPSDVPWPPLLYVTAMVGAYLLQSLAPVALGQSFWLGIAALGLSVAGLALDLWAMRELYRAKTTILPHRGSSQLVTTGPYRFTRNPIYVGNLAFLIGIAILARQPWLILTALIAFVAIDLMAVRPEESHLAARYGKAWEAYARAVPRWIGRPGPVLSDNGERR